MRAVALCFKPFLKPEEALIYCDLGRTQFAKRCEELGVVKNESGYYTKEDLDRICTGKSVAQTLVKQYPARKRGL